MNKAELKNNWGNYCDTDVLVDTMMSLLTKYGHANTEHGVCSVLNTFFTNKRNLIDMFMTSNHYIGNLRIALDIEMERYSSANEVDYCCSNFLSKLDAKKFLLKTTDSQGKRLNDYLNIGISHFKASDLLNTDVFQRIKSVSDGANQFDENGYLVESVKTYKALVRFFSHVMSQNTWPKLNERVAIKAGELPIPVKLTADMKTSRAFNKICTTYGLDKANPITVRSEENGQTITRTVYPYDKLFAEYADLVSDLKRKLKFFISLNPLDYLTMSFGTNWSSCQTIDKTNKRNMPNNYSGGYCGGTLSYMLDSSSIITYVYKTMPESIEEGKIYRNMFHFQNNTLVQGRVYPQGNDGCTDLYTVFREFVQGEFVEMLGLQKNAWTKRDKNCIISNGVHYKDYNCYGGCNVTYPTEKANQIGQITIGHDRICPKCGRVVEGNGSSGRLVHLICSD